MPADLVKGVESLGDGGLVVAAAAYAREDAAGRRGFATQRYAYDGLVRGKWRQAREQAYTEAVGDEGDDGGPLLRLVGESGREPGGGARHERDVVVVNAVRRKDPRLVCGLRELDTGSARERMVGDVTATLVAQSANGHARP